jgi:hypothetical protein
VEGGEDDVEDRGADEAGGERPKGNRETDAEYEDEPGRTLLPAVQEGHREW